MLLQNWSNFVLLQIGTSLITNSGSFILLQIGASVITNWGSFVITNWGKCYYKLEQLNYYKSRLLQVRGNRYYKLGLVENLYWKDHIKYTENKVAENIGLLYRTKLFLDKNSLLTLYHSYIHTYLNYANLSWGSTNRTNLKELLCHQKYAVRIINNRKRLDHTNELFKSQKILNFYKLNISSVAVSMYPIRNKTAPLTFSGSSEKISCGYPTNFSQFNYKTPKAALSKSKFRISFRGLSIWNKFL